MTQLQKALELIRKRLRDKRLRAEDAYVNSKKQKITENCKNCGPQLGDQLWGCKILAMGKNGLEASMCHNNKAAFCPLFETPKTQIQFREEFQLMPPDQLAIRWPAVGELIRVEQLLSSITQESGHDS